MSRWIEFIRDYARKNNLSYGCAISQPNVAYEYHKKYNTAKYQKMRKAGIESESLDEALPSEVQVKTPINLKKKMKKKPSNEAKEAFKMSSEDLLSRRTINTQELITPVKKSKKSGFIKTDTITSDGEPVFISVKKDKFDNRWLFGEIDNYFGFMTPEGKVYRFKSGKFPNTTQEDYYEKILAMSITDGLIGDKNNYLKLL